MMNLAESKNCNLALDVGRNHHHITPDHAIMYDQSRATMIMSPSDVAISSYSSAPCQESQLSSLASLAVGATSTPKLDVPRLETHNCKSSSDKKAGIQLNDEVQGRKRQVESSNDGGPQIPERLATIDESSAPISNDIEDGLVLPTVETGGTGSSNNEESTSPEDTNNVIEMGNIVTKQYPEEAKEEHPIKDDSTACNSIENDIENPREGEEMSTDRDGSQVPVESHSSIVIAFPTRAETEAATNQKKKKKPKNIDSLEDDDDDGETYISHQRKPHHVLMERAVLVMVIVLVIILAIGLATLPNRTNVMDDLTSSSSSSDASFSTTSSATSVATTSLSPTPASISPP